MNQKKKTRQEIDPNNEEIWEEDFNGLHYAFIDQIEILENDRVIIQFESIELTQIETSIKKGLKAEFEELEPSVIVCDFSKAIYNDFTSYFKNEFFEGNWVILELTEQLSKYKTTVIPEYFEGNPNFISKYIGDGCQLIDPNLKNSLEAIFQMQSDDEEFINFSRFTTLKKILQKENGELRIHTDVAIYNVGQGSLNAILDQDGIPMAYFDVGGGAYWNANTYTPNQLLNLCFTKNPTIVLSHWDFDHWWTFNKLLRLHRPIPHTTWIVPFQKLGPIQYKFYNLLKNEGHTIAVWPKDRRSLNTPFGQIVKCDGVKQGLKTNNDNGLFLVVENQNSRILLPADASYEVIKTKVKGQFSGLVATHHGGKSTDNINLFPGPVSNCSRIVYSYGKLNRYHHPNGTTVLKHISAGWKLVRETPYGSVSMLSLATHAAPCNGQCDLNIDQTF